MLYIGVSRNAIGFHHGSNGFFVWMLFTLQLYFYNIRYCSCGS